MIVLALAGLGHWALVGFEFGFDGLFAFFSGVLVVLYGYVLFTSWYSRRHRYDGIESGWS